MHSVLTRPGCVFLYNLNFLCTTPMNDSTAISYAEQVTTAMLIISGANATSPEIEKNGNGNVEARG